jgi:hypothetical protein
MIYLSDANMEVLLLIWTIILIVWTFAAILSWVALDHAKRAHRIDIYYWTKRQENSTRL